MDRKLEKLMNDTAISFLMIYVYTFLATSSNVFFTEEVNVEKL